MEDHVPRHAQMGAWVLINDRWYKGAFRPLRDPCNNALTIRDHAFNTNLGIAASQDDASLQAIIPWGPKEAV